MEEADQKLAETHEENWDEVIPCSSTVPRTRRTSCTR